MGRLKRVNIAKIQRCRKIFQVRVLRWKADSPAGGLGAQPPDADNIFTILCNCIGINVSICIIFCVYSRMEEWPLLNYTKIVIYIDIYIYFYLFPSVS